MDLYGGTRHSTVTALGEIATPEQIKRATEHSTNAAFERYMQRDTREKLNIFRLADTGTKPAPEKPGSEKGKILKLKE